MHCVLYGQVTLIVPDSNSSTPTFKHLFVLHFEYKYMCIATYIGFLIFLNVHTITHLIWVLKNIFYT